MRAFVVAGCAISGSSILAYSAGAATVAANAVDVAESIQEIKEIRSGAKVPLPCGEHNETNGTF